METNKKKYLAPSQTVMEIDDTQLFLMSSEPGTGGQDYPGGNAARGNSMGWGDED